MDGKTWLGYAGILLVLASCGATEPYVFKPGEFDRTADDFNQPIVDRDSVTICFNGWVTDDADVAAMAQEECHKFGKNAHVRSEIFDQCPLLTPSQADFACNEP
ncbi:MAG: hypothetical protein H6905_00445 [Hyphomicrobiales bacterium]|nr:hypothetical protein [Hyphomicrobiales bacterium]